MTENKKRQTSWQELIVLIFAIPLLISIIPLLLCIGVIYVLATILIYLSVWVFWNSRDIHLLYVYSNSPNWQEYIEKEILPNLPERKIVLNWSERKQWKKLSLAKIAFYHFGGGWQEYNPMAVIFRPFRRAKVFRFYEPFKDFKHGKPEALLKIETEFFQALKS
jgi:hypothetical protein